MSEIHACILQLDVDRTYADICNIMKNEMIDNLEYKTILKSSGISNKRRRSAAKWWNNNLGNDRCDAEKRWLKQNPVQKSSNFYLFVKVSERYLIRMFRRQNEDIAFMLQIFTKNIR